MAVYGSIWQYMAVSAVKNKLQASQISLLSCFNLQSSSISPDSTHTKAF